tara:strand:+ start:336 stop:1787 length:1452 start_codon:yes stop_codon:yes gene_type:complete
MISNNSIYSKEKNKFLKLISKNLKRDSIIYGNKKINYEDLISYIIQINNFLTKNKLENKTIIIQLKNRLHTFLFYLAAIFSKTTICPLDPKLPTSRVKNIKQIINAKKIIKKINLNNKKNKDIKKLNLKNHNFLITFSSGTSGKPKGICHDANNILGISFSYSKLVKFNKKTQILHCLPEFYMAGIVNNFFSCLCGSSKIILVNSFNKNSIFSIWSDIRKYKVNTIYLIPSIYSMVTNFSPNNAAVLVKKYKIKFLSTSNNLYPNIRKTFYKKFKTKILSCYGITEMGGPLTNELNGSLETDSVGKLIDGCNFKIVRLNNKNILFFKSKFLCTSIIKDTKFEKLKLDKKGFFNSQDTGFLKNKNLIITGREKDILKKGGEFINLKDIENIILSWRMVRDVAAISIENELSDEKLHIFIVLKTKLIKREYLDELMKIIDTNMYKTEKPDKIVFLRKMPKTVSGKIVKRELKFINAKNKIREIIL